MRMRRKKNLIPRMEACADWLIREPQTLRGIGGPCCRGPRPSGWSWLRQGRFTCETAAAEPEVLFVAVERVPDAMVMAMERARDLGLRNVFFVDADAAGLPDFFAPGEVDRLYINFCDPWPTKRHAKRRLTHRNFLLKYRQVLPDGGRSTLRPTTPACLPFPWRSFLPGASSPPRSPTTSTGTASRG